MKLPLQLLLIAALASAAGWMAGSRSEEKPRPVISVPRKNVMGAMDRPAWASQLSTVRAVPGKGAEIAWLHWAFTIPDADVPAAIAMLNPRADFTALRCLYARWVTLDSAAAWTSFRASEIPNAVSHFAMRGLHEGKKAGMESISTSYNPRSLIASRMLAAWAAKDKEAAKAFAARLNAGNAATRQGIPLEGWMSIEVDRLDGKGTLAQSPDELKEAAFKAIALPRGAKRDESIQDAARSWLNKDPAAACEWLRSLSPDERLYMRLANIAYAFRNLPGSDRVQTLVAANLSSEDTNSLTGAIRGLSDPGTVGYYSDNNTAYLAATGMKEWMQESPAAAQAWLAAQPEGDLTALLTGAAAGQLTRTNPSAALDLVSSAGGDQSIAVQAFVQGWTEYDARAAVSWAGKIEDTAIRDAALTVAAQALTTQEPRLAAETASLISDAPTRNKLLRVLDATLVWNPAAGAALADQFPPSRNAE